MLDRSCTPAQGHHETGGLLSLFCAFPATFQWQTACKSDLRVFSWGLHSGKFRKTALGSNDLSTLRLKTEVEIFRGVRTPLVPLTSYAPVLWRMRMAPIVIGLFGVLTFFLSLLFFDSCSFAQLDDKPIQHREVHGYESDLFRGYFKKLEIWSGG